MTQFWERDLSANPKAAEQDQASQDSINAKRFKFLIEHIGSVSCEYRYEMLPDGHAYCRFTNITVFRCDNCNDHIHSNAEDVLVPQIDNLMKKAGLL